MIKTYYNANYIFIDLFGGSGFLSHITHYTYPNAHVIYNDYDNYVDRINNIDTTNEIIEKLRIIFNDNNIGSQQKCTEDVKMKVIEVLQSYEDNGRFVDYETLSCNLCFSNRINHDIDAMMRDPMYNRLRKDKYKQCSDYLNGLDIVHEDYKSLYAKFKDNANAVFIIDPPYMAVDIRQYKMESWILKDFLDVLLILFEQKHWIYFTCDYSSLRELLEWLDAHISTHILDNTVMLEKEVVCSYRKRYVDIMIYRTCA